MAPSLAPLQHYMPPTPTACCTASTLPTRDTASCFLSTDGVAAPHGIVCHDHTELCPIGDVLQEKNNNNRFVVLANLLQFTAKERHRLLAEKSQHPSLPGHIITLHDSTFHLGIREFSSLLVAEDVSFSSLFLKGAFLGIAA